MKPSKRDRDPLLLEIAAAIGAGRIRLTSLASDQHQYVHGVTEEDGTITINPVPATVDTIIHECCHRLRPEWTERGVLRKTKQLMATLSDAEIDRLYVLTEISAKKRSRKAVVR